jgi:hypothetical protein
VIPGAPRAALSVLAGALAVYPALSPAPTGEANLALRFEPVPLDPGDPGRERVGGLSYRGGLWLRSPDPRFGGLSDLRVLEGGRRLVAVSDCGHVFEAELVHDERGFLVGLAEARLRPLLGPSGRALAGAEIDAEGLAVFERSLVVSFEGRHRLWRYTMDPPLAGSPTPMPAPPGLGSSEGNAGAEALAGLPDGRLLVLTEGDSGRPATARGWVGRRADWSALSYPLEYGADAPDEPFRPTGAAVHGGELLVLERRYPPLAARIRRLSVAALGQASPEGLVGSELARLEAPLTLDNLEGIDVAAGARGETLVYLVSDDNDCAKLAGWRRRGVQRTLLLSFALSG